MKDLKIKQFPVPQMGFSKYKITIKKMKHIVVGNLYFLSFDNMNSDKSIASYIGIDREIFRKIISLHINKDQIKITPNNEFYFKTKLAAYHASYNLIAFLKKNKKYLIFKDRFNNVDSTENI